MFEWMVRHRRTVELIVLGIKIIILVASFTIPAWLASLSSTINAYGSIAWFAAGTLGALSVSIIWFLYSLARQYLGHSRLLDMRAIAPAAVNPLEMSFGSRAIKLIDAKDPIADCIVGKTFDRCDILGLAVVTVTGATAFLHCQMIDTDHVLIRPDAAIHNVIVLDGCTFNRCRVIGLSFLIPPIAANIIPPGVNWITQPPQPQAASKRNSA